MTDNPKIIARGYNDKPVVLYAIDLDKRHIGVAPRPCLTAVIGWPVNDAFDYDEDDWKVVSEAYESDDRATLTARYREMERRSKRFIDVLMQREAGR